MTGTGATRAGTALGVVWALGVMVVGGMVVTLPVFTLMPTIMTAFLAPGLVMGAMVARAAYRAPRAAQTDRMVLHDTALQLGLALAIWPAAAVLLAGKGPGLILTLGLAFVPARLAFWVGSHRAPGLRAFGVAATFFPTGMAAIWALWNVATGFR